MSSHLVALLVFSALVAVVFALLQRQGKRERIRFGVMAFGAFVLSALVVGWLMFPFPS
jgi:hypothetical protein